MKYFQLLPLCIILYNQSYIEGQEECKDHIGAVFKKNNGKNATCKNIANGERRHKFCQMKTNLPEGSEEYIYELCPKTCWQCSTEVTYPEKCEDTELAVYIQNNNKVTTCKRIRNLKWEKTYCGRDANTGSSEGTRISTLCPKTCGKCGKFFGNKCEDDETFFLVAKKMTCKSFASRPKTCKEKIYLGRRVSDRCCATCKKFLE